MFAIHDELSVVTVTQASTFFRLQLHITFTVDRDIQTFLSEDHISYYATVREPDILHNVNVS